MFRSFLKGSRGQQFLALSPYGIQETRWESDWLPKELGSL